MNIVKALSKLFYLTTFCLLIGVGYTSAQVKRAIASGEWSNSSIWSPTGEPSSTDSVIVDQTGLGDFITVTISNANATCAALVIDPDYIGSELSINFGKVLTVSRSITINGSLNLSNGAQVNVAGDWTNNGIFSYGNSTVRFFGSSNQEIAGSGTFDNFVVNKSSGIVSLVSGDYSVNSNWTDSSGTVDLGSFRMDRTASGGTFVLASGATLKIGGTNSFPLSYNTYTLASTSTVEYNGGTQSSVPNRNYGNLTLTSSGGSVTKTASEGITVNGNFTINSGVTFSGGSSRTHKVGGNWTNNGSYSTGSGNIVELNGTGTQTVGGSSVTQFRTFRVNKTSGSAILSNNISISGTGAKLLVSSGTFDISTYTANRTSASDSFAVYGSSTFRMEGPNNFPSNYGPVYFSSSSTCEYHGATAQTISARSYGNLTLSGSGNKSVSANDTINGTLTVGSGITYFDSLTSITTYLNGNLVVNGTYVGIGTTIFSGSTTLSGSGTFKFGNVTITGTLNDGGKTIQVRGDWTNSGALTASGTVQFDSTLSQSIGASSFYNLTVNKSSGIVNANGNLTVNNDFSLTSGTFQANSVTINVARNWSRTGTFTAGTSTVIFGGSSAQTITGTQFNKLTMSGDGLKTLSSSGIKVSGLWTITGNGGYNDGGFPDTLLGNLDNSSVFDGTGSAVFGGNDSLKGSGTFRFGSVNITFGNSLNTNGKTITLRGSWTNAGTFISSDTVRCEGTSAQTLNTAKFAYLVINKTSGTVTLGGTDSITNTLTISSGTLNTSGNSLVVGSHLSINSAGILEGSSSTIYVGGNWGNSGTFTAGTSSVIFNSSSAQSLDATTFNTLTLSGSGAKTAMGNITTNGIFTIGTGTSFVENTNSLTTTVNGNLVANGTYLGIGTTIFGGTTTLSGVGNFKFGSVNITGTFNDGGKTIQVRRNWTKSGTFTSSGTAQFDSTLTQTIGTSNFNNLVTNKGSDSVKLSGNVTVAGSFNLNAGIFSTGVSNNSVTTTSDFFINAGTVLANGSTITVGRHWKNNGTFTSGNSTVHFNGAVTESVYTANFYNVSFSGAGTKYLVGSTYAVTGDVSILTPAIVSATGNGTITISGNWSNSGTFTPNTSNLIFNKSGVVTWSGNTNVHDFSISSGTTISMSGNDTIIFSATGSFTETGYLSGRIRYTQNLSTPSTNYTFGNIGATLNYTGSSPGSTTIIRTTGSTASGLSQAVSRFYYIFPTTNSGLNITLLARYRDSELNGQTESALKLWKRTEGLISWTRQTSSVVDTSANTLTQSGITSLSTWGISATDVRVFDVTSGNWNDSTSWSPAGIPTSGDSIYIPSGKVCTIPAGYSVAIYSLNNFGTLISSGSDSVTVTSNWVNNGTFTPSTSTVKFSGTNQSISGSSFNNVLFSNSGTKTLNGSLNISGIVQINSGVTVNGGSYTHSVQGNWANTGTFTSTGQVSFSGSNQTISSGTFNSIALKGTGTKTITGNLTINGNDSISSGVIVDAGSNSLSVAGNWINQGTFINTDGTITFSGTTQTISSSAFGNVIFAGSGMKTATGALVIKGNVTINSGVTFVPGANIDSVSGNWTKNGSFDSTGSTVVFNGTNTQTISSSGFHSVVFVNSGVKSVSGAINVGGDFTIASGSSFSAGNFTHTLRGNWTNNGTFTPNSSTLVFSKSGTATFSGSTTVNNLTVNSSTILSVVNPGVITLNGTLTESGYLMGRIQKAETISNLNVLYTFGGIGANIIAATGATPLGATTIISYRKEIPTGFASNQAVQRYYSITPTNGSSNITYGFRYKGTQELNSQTETQLKLWRSTNNGTLWLREATSTVDTLRDSLSLLSSDISTSTTIFAISPIGVREVNVSGNWNVDTTWSPTGIPTSGDSVYIAAGKTVTIAGSDSVFVGGINIGGTLTFASNGALTVSRMWNNTGGTINNGSGTIYFSGSPLLLNGTSHLRSVVINTGKTLTMLSGSSLGISQSLTINGTLDALTYTPNTILYNGLTSQTITPATYHRLVVSNGNTKSLSSSVTVSDSLRIDTLTTLSDNAQSFTVKGIVQNKGTFSGTGTLISGGTVTLTGSGTYSLGSVQILSTMNLTSGNIALTLNGDLSNSGTSFSNTGTVTFAGTNRTITGSNIQFKKLKITGSINSSASITLTDSFSITGSFVSSASTDFGGTTVLTGSATLFSSTIKNTGNSNTDTLILAPNSLLEIRQSLSNSSGNGRLTTDQNTSNTVWYSSTSSSIVGITYHHLRLTGGGTKFAAGNITINGNFSVDSSSTFDGQTFTTVFNGTSNTLSSTPTGSFQFNNLTINSGKSLNAGTLSFSVRGDWTNNGTFTSSGTGTVTLNGTTQQLSRSLFQNMILGGSGVKTVTGNMIVNGNITVNSGATVTFSTTTIDTVKGNFTNNGSFIPTNSTFVFNGTSPQTIGGSAFAFNKLIINKTDSIILGASGNVDDTLRLISGKIRTNNNILTLGSTGTLIESGNNKISGILRTTRNVFSGTPGNTFGNLGLKIVAVGNAPGSTQVTRYTDTTLNGAGIFSNNKSIRRFFDIVPVTNTNLNATVEFYYNANEIFLPNEESKLRLWNTSDVGTTWNIIPGSVVNQSADFITVNGVNSLNRLTASSLTLQPKTAIVRMWRDTDGIDSTVNDWVPTFWGMEARRGSLIGSRVGFTASDSILIVDTLSDTTYYAATFDSSRWTRKAYRLDGTLVKSTANNVQFGFSNTNVRTVEFSAFHPSTLTLRFVKDGDGDFSTRDDTVQIPWDFTLYNGSVQLLQRKRQTNVYQLIDSLLEDYAFTAESRDSLGWIPLGYFLDSAGISSAVLSGSRPARRTISTFNGQHYTITFVGYAANAVIIRKFQDSDGEFSTSNDRGTKPWNLKIYRQREGLSDTLVGEVANARELTVTNLPDGNYIATEADSASWRPIGHILRGVPVTDTSRSVSFSISGGDTTRFDFVNVQYNTIVVKYQVDRDNNFYNDQFQESYPWHLRVHKNSPSGILLGSISGTDPADTILAVPNLLDGIYYAVAVDSSGWRRLGNIYSQRSPEKDTSSNVTELRVDLIGGGRTAVVTFVGSNADSASFRTLKQLSDGVRGKALKLKFKKGKPLPVHTDANIRDTAFEKGFPKKSKKLMILGMEQTNKDSAKKYGWILFKKAISIGKFLPQGTYRGGFDFIDLSNSKLFRKALKNPKVDKYSNKIAAELAILKLNIMASEGGVTPPGFGKLRFNEGGANIHQLNGLTVEQIGGTPVSGGGMLPGLLDSALTYHKTFSSDFFYKATDALTKINEAFWEAASTDDTITVIPLKLNGTKKLSEIDFLTTTTSKSNSHNNFLTTYQKPVTFELFQNYPNPFNASTTIEYYLADDAVVTLKIYNILGQEVKTLVTNQFVEGGWNDVDFDASNLVSGVYFYRIFAAIADDEGSATKEEYVQTKKLILLK